LWGCSCQVGNAEGKREKDLRSNADVEHQLKRNKIGSEMGKGNLRSKT